MNKSELFSEIQKKESFLCVGLDTDIQKIPPHLLKAKDPVFEFNRQIIDHTAEYCVAYKPNIAFYEALGAKGWESLEKTLAYIPKNIFTIADAKRGDIGNTSSLYARAFFEQMNFDAVTVAPYMGEDSVKPFLDFPGKWVILLALTSNPGSRDFQHLTLSTDGKRVFETVLNVSKRWGHEDNLMYVVGATQAQELTEIRKIVPDHFLLVPGVGAQGGSLEEVARHGMNGTCGLLVNSSRGIIYQSANDDFGLEAAKAAKAVRADMQKLLDRYL